MSVVSSTTASSLPPPRLYQGPVGQVSKSPTGSTSGSPASVSPLEAWVASVGHFFSQVLSWIEAKL